MILLIVLNDKESVLAVKSLPQQEEKEEKEKEKKGEDKEEVTILTIERGRFGR